MIEIVFKNGHILNLFGTLPNQRDKTDILSIDFNELKEEPGFPTLQFIKMDEVVSITQEEDLDEEEPK